MKIIIQEEHRQISSNFRSVYHVHRKAQNSQVREQLENGWKYNISVLQPLYR